MPLNNHYRKSDVYDNGLVIGQNGRPVCTLNSKRLDWYLKRGLAEEIIPPTKYSRAIKLNFKPKYDRPPERYELAIIRNECCLCGTKNKLTLHHVVPKVIRQRFPPQEKNRSRQWCLLLCLDCHKKVEEITQILYKNNYPNGVNIDEKKSSFVLRRLKGMGILDRLGPEKMEKLMREAGYDTVNEIPAPPTDDENDALHRHASNLHRKAIDKWAHAFIEEHGSIEGTKAYFRELFLSFNPQYVPEGYLDL